MVSPFNVITKCNTGSRMGTYIDDQITKTVGSRAAMSTISVSLYIDQPEPSPEEREEHSLIFNQYCNSCIILQFSFYIESIDPKPLLWRGLGGVIILSYSPDPQILSHRVLSSHPSGSINKRRSGWFKVCPKHFIHLSFIKFGCSPYM
jgi:hypothetical protein